MSRGDILKDDVQNENISERRSSNALRESNREDTRILYQQAGISKWLNKPYALNLALVSTLSIVATGLVYLLR